MKISAKIDYACRALVELGLHWPNTKPLQVSEIAKKQKIPIKFLVHILIQLKESGYVDSVRGKMGGYVLTKSPDMIKFSDIIKNFGGLGLNSDEDVKKRKLNHVMDYVWQEIDDVVLKAIDKTNLQMICDRQRSQGKIIMYEI